MNALQLAKRALVKVFLELAGIYGVVLAVNRDSADKEVKAAYRRVIVKAHPDKGGSAAHAQKLNDAFRAWEEAARASMSHGRAKAKAKSSAKAKAKAKADPGPLAQQKEPYRIRGQHVLLTYQSFPGLGAWPDFAGFPPEHMREWGVRYWCVTLEANRNETLRGHLMLQFTSAKDISVNTFIFMGIRPNASNMDLCGEGLCRKKPQQSIDRGFFYVWANKIGTQTTQSGDLCVAGNYAPAWTDMSSRYMVLGKWPETIWRQYKLTHEQYHEYLFACRDGVLSRKRNFDMVVAEEDERVGQKAIDARVARIRANQALYAPFPEVPEASAWLQLFKSDALRYPILVVLGPSHSGKTEWAKSLFKQPLKLEIGILPQFPETMRTFDRRKHDAIILDDLRDMAFLTQHQEKIQGKYDLLVEFGTTPGGTCAYKKDLFAVPVVATANESTANLAFLDSHDWLSRAENRVIVRFPRLAQ